MQQYKLRTIIKSETREVKGIMVPTEVAQFFSGCYFRLETIKISGKYGLFFVSGTLSDPTKEEVEKYDFSKCRV